MTAPIYGRAKDIADRCGKPAASAAHPLSPREQLTAPELALEMALPIASGALLAAAFMRPPYHLLAWVALIPFAAAIAAGRGSFYSYFGAYVGGAIFHLHALEWFRTQYDTADLVGSPVVDWFLNGMLCASVWPLVLLLGRRLLAVTSFPLIVVLPIAWIAGEYFRLEFGYVVSQTPFPWVQVGFTQAPELNLIQVADLGGVWAITALVTMVNGACCDAIVRKRWRPVAVAALLMTAAWLYGEFRCRQTATEPGPTVALVPKWIQPSAATDNFPTADLLLWSEGAYHEPPTDGNPRAMDELDRCARRTGSVLVVGSRRESRDKWYNSCIIVDPRKGYLGYYDKCNLVPWKEFIPWAARTARDKFTHGTTQPVFPVRSTSFGPSICYDVCFDRFYSGYQPKPDFFIVSSCESFDGTGYATRCLLDMTRFRAIENRRSFIRNVEAGHSGMIDSTGRLVADPGNYWRSAVMLGPVPIDRRISFYSQFGNWLPIASCMGVLLALARARRLKLN